LPASKEQKFKFGTFSTKYNYDEKTNAITSVAYLELKDNVIPAENFTEARKFFSDVIKEFTEKIVVKRK
jgi:hypothetical protein